MVLSHVYWLVTPQNDVNPIWYMYHYHYRFHYRTEQWQNALQMYVRFITDCIIVLRRPNNLINVSYHYGNRRHHHRGNIYSPKFLVQSSSSSTSSSESIISLADTQPVAVCYFDADDVFEHALLDWVALKCILSRSMTVIVMVALILVILFLFSYDKP